MCGGTAVTIWPTNISSGLSPRVRGNLRLSATETGDPRSIPACAGEPHVRTESERVHEVYPRVCGGTLVFGGTDKSYKGLSPRVRGNPGGTRPGASLAGSIPACAGEPLPSLGSRSRNRVYPRVCGGTIPHIPTCRPRRGLSPRVRGNLWRLDAAGRRFRSIPACAGEPRLIHALGAGQGVYPRVCGGTNCNTPQ